MVQSMWLVNNENNQDAWQWPQHEIADLASEKRLMNEEEVKPLQKRWNSSFLQTNNEVLIYVFVYMICDFTHLLFFLCVIDVYSFGHKGLFLFCIAY